MKNIKNYKKKLEKTIVIKKKKSNMKNLMNKNLWKNLLVNKIKMKMRKKKNKMKIKMRMMMQTNNSGKI